MLPTLHALAIMASVRASAEVPVVLRVKRKRTEDPADALAVRKIKRLDLSAHKEDTSIFHFVGTVAEKNDSEKAVLEQLHRHRDHRSLAKSNPLSRLTIADRHDSYREKKKASSSNQRFKLVCQLRHIDNGDGVPPETLESREQPVKELMSEMVHLYDVVQEQPSERGCQGRDVPTPVESDSSLSTMSASESSAITCNASEDGTITCNATRMVREKLLPRTDGSNEYVYDLYCTRDCSGQEVISFDWSSLSVYTPELVHDILDQDEYLYDDEDDSNDENNWRNDYPDEDDSERSCSDSGEEERGHSNAPYRHRELCYDEYQFEDEPYLEDRYRISRPDDLDSSPCFGDGEYSS